MLAPCKTDGCTARIDARHMPGQLSGECFRQLGPKRKHHAVKEQRRGHDPRVARHSTK